MTLFSFITLIIVVIIIAVIAEILWNRYQNEAIPPELVDVKDKVSATVTQAVNEAKEAGGKVWNRQQPDLVGPFKRWVAEDLADAELKNWLLSLSDEGFNALTEQLAAFYVELNMELSWLSGGQLEMDPKLKNVAHQVAISYCSACRQAVQVQQESQLFKQFLDVVENPSGKAHQEISHKVLVALRKQELAPPASPELLLASEKERQDYLSQIIRQAIETDRQKVYAIFQNSL